MLIFYYKSNKAHIFNKLIKIIIQIQSEQGNEYKIFAAYNPGSSVSPAGFPQ